MVEDIVSFFFSSINVRGKYEIKVENNCCYIIPREEEKYFKPYIIVKDIKELEDILCKYIEAVYKFYQNTDKLKEVHNTGYFFNNLFFNMCNSDALDINEYIKRRISFFNDLHFRELDSSLVKPYDNYNILCKREVANLGFESPYVLKFKMEINKENYDLPLIRYAIDDKNICHLFAIQFERGIERNNENAEYKKIINLINSGVKKYRNVQPSFVLVFKQFIDLLSSEDIKDILIPDYLFARYKNYYCAKTVKKSDEILERILDYYILLIQRMEYQFPGFEITYYPNEIDSFTHVKLKKPSKKIV